MRNVLMALAAAALVAAAFFLPEQLSLLEDQQLLDRPNIVQQEEREGFAESMQLQVAEKLLLMRSATVSRMELGDGVVQGLYDMGTQETTLLTATYEAAWRRCGGSCAPFRAWAACRRCGARTASWSSRAWGTYCIWTPPAR